MVVIEFGTDGRSYFIPQSTARLAIDFACKCQPTRYATIAAKFQRLGQEGWDRGRYYQEHSQIRIRIPRSVRDSPHQDDELAELFRRILPPEGKRRDSLQSTFGCGFILSTDGLILTDTHLPDNANEIWVRLRDSRSFKAKVLGRDALTDVALLKIDATDLPIVRIGDPNKLEVGDWVLAIGAPFGFEHSVTQGIVSATGRALPDEYYVPFIQTDVSINPGNSGGPMFNMDAEVVAINSQIYTRSGGYMGISFAIPIDLAMGIKEQLLKGGKVTRGRIGVSHQAVDETIAQAFHLETVMGALITEVDKNGPAEKAGIVPGDIVLKFDGGQFRFRMTCLDLLPTANREQYRS